ncbi:unnamed protein product [Sympodiomycopsis kandeliae]
MANHPNNNAHAPPYLTLSIPQALALPDPPAPEQRTWNSIIELIQHRARYQNEKVAVGFSELVDAQNAKWEATTLTYGSVSLLSQQVAATLRPQLSSAVEACPPTDPGLPPLKPAPVIGILCPSGLDFFVHALAVWQLGCALLPIAIGTTEDGVRNLLEKTGASALITHSSQSKLAKGSLVGLRDGVRIVETIPRQQLETMLSAKPDVSVESLAEITPESSIIIFHSSGSTGLPKPIYHIQRFWTFSLASAAGTDLAAYTTTPLYHGGMSDFLRSLQAGSSIFFHPITGESNTLSIEHIVNGSSASESKSSNQFGYFLSVPFVLEMLSKSQEGLDYLSSKKLVSTGGAPLPETVGERLVSAGVPLVSRLGSSECGFLMSSFRDFDTDKEWNWLRIDDQLGQEWIDFREDNDNPGLCELIVTKKWPTKLLSNAPDQAFSTQDLYSRHPDHPTWYRYATRVDDTLVLLNGKKFAAGLIEMQLRRSPFIEDAIVFGSNRALVGAVIIPSNPTTKVQDLVEKLTPELSQINSSLPSHARLTPELLIVADQSLAESIPRSSKGTLQRGHAYRQLDSLFDDLYQAYEEGTVQWYPSKKNPHGESLQEIITAIVSNALGMSISPDLDFYKAGMDSIGAIKIKAGVHRAIDLGKEENGEAKKLSTNAIYEHPSVYALARHIEHITSKAGESNGELASSVEDEMRSMVDKYAQKLPAFKPRPQQAQGKRAVILTGVTGALGSHLLATLLERSESRVDQVLCLVRADSDQSATKRVQESLSLRQLSDRVVNNADNWSRVACFASDLSHSPKLGLSDSFWTTLTTFSEVSVVHAAWTVNFALSLKSFEADNIQGLFNLLCFALEQGISSFVFCSSLASVLSSPGRILEEVSQSPSTAGKVGYSQSKWVSELLCSHTNLNIKIARLGQLSSDTTNGIWNETEAWPLLIRTGSAQEIGSLPLINQRIDWLAVDIAADTLVDLVSSEKGVYHICLPTDNMSDIPNWNDLLSWLHNAGLQFKSVSKEEWLTAVRKNSGKIRGRALIDVIWSSLPDQGDTSGGNVVETTRARRVSLALRRAKAMDQEVVHKTLEVWKRSGFLS